MEQNIDPKAALPALSKTRLSLPLMWLPIHFFVLPPLLRLFGEFYPKVANAQNSALMQMALSCAFLVFIQFGYLRADFNSLLDRKLKTVLAMISGYMLCLVLSFFCGIASLLFPPWVQDVLDTLARQTTMPGQRGAFALFVVLTPLFDGMIFRGCVFGSLRKHSRLLAYILSVLLCAAAAVLPLAMTRQDMVLLVLFLYALPSAIALCWCYDSSGSLWASMFLNMLIATSSLGGA